MTLQQVASAIGVGEKTLAKNVGEGYLSLTTALAISAFMDAKFDVLFGPDISHDWGKFAKMAKKYLQ
jgi:DNA-binding XRE family transcriptional regulator